MISCFSSFSAFSVKFFFDVKVESSFEFQKADHPDGVFPKTDEGVADRNECFSLGH